MNYAIFDTQHISWTYHVHITVVFVRWTLEDLFERLCWNSLTLLMELKNAYLTTVCLRLVVKLHLLPLVYFYHTFVLTFFSYQPQWPYWNIYHKTHNQFQVWVTCLSSICHSLLVGLATKIGCHCVTICPKDWRCLMISNSNWSLNMEHDSLDGCCYML